MNPFFSQCGVPDADEHPEFAKAFVALRGATAILRLLKLFYASGASLASKRSSCQVILQHGDLTTWVNPGTFCNTSEATA